MVPQPITFMYLLFPPPHDPLPFLGHVDTQGHWFVGIRAKSPRLERFRASIFNFPRDVRKPLVARPDCFSCQKPIPPFLPEFCREGELLLTFFFFPLPPLSRGVLLVVSSLLTAPILLIPGFLLRDVLFSRLTSYGLFPLIS